jgi:hypothetical protein
MTFAIGVIDGAGVSPGARAAWVGLIWRPNATTMNSLAIGRC